MMKSVLTLQRQFVSCHGPTCGRNIVPSWRKSVCAVSPVTRRVVGFGPYQTVRLALYFSNYAEGSITDDVQWFVEV